MKQNIKQLKPKTPFNARKGWHHEYLDDAELLVRDGYKAERCTGEAHSNPHIDNCGQCAPLWGVVAVKDCLHDDIQRLDSRNDRCVMCGATFDGMDSWDEEDE